MPSPITLKIKFKSATLEEFIERYAVDLSADGIFIRTKQPLQVGQPLKFEFQLTDGTALLSGEGAVEGARPFDAARTHLAPGMGVRFGKLTPQSQEVVDRILAAKTERGEVGESRFEALLRETAAAGPIDDADRDAKTPLPSPLPGLSAASAAGGLPPPGSSASDFSRDDATRVMQPALAEALLAASRTPAAVEPVRAHAGPPHPPPQPHAHAAAATPPADHATKPSAHEVQHVAPAVIQPVHEMLPPSLEAAPAIAAPPVPDALPPPASVDESTTEPPLAPTPDFAPLGATPEPTSLPPAAEAAAPIEPAAVAAEASFAPLADVTSAAPPATDAVASRADEPMNGALAATVNPQITDAVTAGAPASPEAPPADTKPEAPAAEATPVAPTIEAKPSVGDTKPSDAKPAEARPEEKKPVASVETKKADVPKGFPIVPVLLVIGALAAIGYFLLGDSSQGDGKATPTSPPAATAPVATPPAAAPVAVPPPAAPAEAAPAVVAPPAVPAAAAPTAPPAPAEAPVAAAPPPPAAPTAPGIEIPILSTPPGASITVDGMPFGVTPSKVPLAPGTPHAVVLSLRGFKEVKLNVAAKAGAKVAAKLVETEKLASVGSTPPGADVLLDGKKVGKTGTAPLSVKLGSVAKGRKLIVRKAGFTDDVHNIDATSMFESKGGKDVLSITSALAPRAPATAAPVAPAAPVAAPKAAAKPTRPAKKGTKADTTIKVPSWMQKPAEPPAAP